MDPSFVEELDDAGPKQQQIICSVLQFPSSDCAVALYDRDEWHMLRLDFEHANSKLGFFLDFWRGKKLNGRQQKQYESMQAATTKAHLKMVQYKEEFIGKFAASEVRTVERKRVREEHEGEDPLSKRVRKMIEKAIKEKAEQAFDNAVKEAVESREDMSVDAVTARAVKAYQEKLVQDFPGIEQID